MELEHAVGVGSFEYSGKIAALLPPDVNNGKDIQTCKENAVGIFSISEMYHALCDYDMNEVDKSWKDIWRLKVPERVRAFVCIVKHNRLLTNERKYQMGLGSDVCDFCRVSKDTTLHALRDCVLVRPLWLSVVDTTMRQQFFTSNLDEWIALNVAWKSGRNNNVDWSCYWAMACHCAWTWRNKENHDADFVRPIKQVEFVRQRLEVYKLADKVIQEVDYQTHTLINIGWVPPLVGWVCLNIDGACKDGVIGCGGVIRGSVGEWILGFSKIIGRGEVYMAELWGVLEGLRMAKRMKFVKVEVRIDSLEVVSDIINNKASKVCGRAFIGRIGELVEDSWEVTFKHSYREANQLADALAKHSFLMKDKFTCFQDCPGHYKHILDADEQGVTTPRTVSL
jgi:ribonuclease HI